MMGATATVFGVPLSPAGLLMTSMMTRPILESLDLSAFGFLTPQVCVRDDETDFRFRKSRHRSRILVSYFLIQQGVEVVMSRIHFGCLDRLGDLRR